MTSPPAAASSPAEGSPSLLAFCAWLTAALFFFYAWVTRVAPSVMIEELMRELTLGAAALGSLSAVYFYGYAGMQIPVGLMIDRFGLRRLVTIAALLCAVGSLLFATSSAYWGLAIGRFMIGATAAFSLVGAMAVAGQWFPPRRFALLSGFAMMLGMAGGVFGQAPLRLAVEALGWRHATGVLAIGALLIAIAAWATIRDRQRVAASLPVRAALASVVRNPQTWLIALAGLGTNGPLLGFAGLWGVPYFATVRGLDQTSAGGVTSMLFVGWGVGAPLFGWFSDRIARRRLPFAIGLVICILAMSALVFWPGLPIAVLAGLCFLCGLGGASQIVAFAAVREHNEPAFSGTAIGVVNCAVTAAGALYQPLIGGLLDFAWDGRMQDGARLYAADAYRLAFSTLVAGAVIGLMSVLAVRETACRQVVPDRHDREGPAA